MLASEKQPSQMTLQYLCLWPFCILNTKPSLSEKIKQGFSLQMSLFCWRFIPLLAIRFFAEYYLKLLKKLPAKRQLLRTVFNFGHRWRERKGLTLRVEAFYTDRIKYFHKKGHLIFITCFMFITTLKDCLLHANQWEMGETWKRSLTFLNFCPVAVCLFW